MKNNRRKFIKQAGLASLSAAALTSVAACVNKDSNTETTSPETKLKQDQELDPTVKKRLGPHGKGLPITMAG